MLDRKIVGIFIWRAVGISASFIVAILAARLFGVESAGRLVLVQSTTTVMATFVVLGIDTVAMRELAVQLAKNNYDEVRVIISSALMVAGALLMLMLVGLLAEQYLSFSLTFMSWGVGYFPIIAVAVLGMVLIALFSAFLRAGQHFNAVVWFQSASVSVLLLLGMIVVAKNGDSRLLLRLYAASTIISAIGAILLWRSTWTHGFGIPSFRKSAGFLKTGFAIFFISSGSLLIGWIEVIALHHWVDSREVALFGAAQRIASVVGLPLALINIRAGPRIATLYATGTIDELRKYVFEIVRLSIALGGLILLGLMLFGGMILSWYGTEFIAARRSLDIMLVGQMVNAIAGPVLYVLMMCAKERQAFFCVLAAIVLDAIGAMFLIPRLNLMGAAINCAIAMSMLNIFAAVFVYFFVLKKVDIDSIA